jgi:Family of unknown function (DUF5947)
VTTALERVAARTVARRDRAIRCGLCAVPIPSGHRHLLDEADGVICACAACLLLFDSGPERRYLAVPDRRIRLRPASTDGLNVPVGLAFVVVRPDGRAVAHYPSPLGSTESSVDAGAWALLVEREPALATLRPRVEALLVRANSRSGSDELWLVPIDDCFRLVAEIRGHWTGMSGGSAVWQAVARFFDDLARARHEDRTRQKEES